MSFCPTLKKAFYCSLGESSSPVQWTETPMVSGVSVQLTNGTVYVMLAWHFI